MYVLRIILALQDGQVFEDSDSGSLYEISSNGVRFSIKFL